jgi:hypothetical protein
MNFYCIHRTKFLAFFKITDLARAGECTRDLLVLVYFLRHFKHFLSLLQRTNFIPKLPTFKTTSDNYLHISKINSNKNIKNTYVNVFSQFHIFDNDLPTQVSFIKQDTEICQLMAGSSARESAHASSPQKICGVVGIGRIEWQLWEGGKGKGATSLHCEFKSNAARARFSKQNSFA